MSRPLKTVLRQPTLNNVQLVLFVKRVFMLIVYLKKSICSVHCDHGYISGSLLWAESIMVHSTISIVVYHVVSGVPL